MVDKRASDREGKLIQSDRVNGEFGRYVGGEVECFSDAPYAQSMTVVPLPVTRCVRCYPMPISMCQGWAMGECSGSAGGSVTKCNPVVRGGDGL